MFKTHDYLPIHAHPLISYSWTAICRGAVIHGMTVEKMDSKFAVGVRSRIARASYGIICQEKWDETEHSEEDKFWDEDQQIWTSRTQMKWLITEASTKYHCYARHV